MKVQLNACFNWRRVLRKVPEAIETFADKAAGLLTDRHHGVLLSGTTLMLEICEIEPNTIEQYRRHVPMLCKILRSLLMSGFAPEHDVGGITDPFLQVKVCGTDTPSRHALMEACSAVTYTTKNGPPCLCNSTISDHVVRLCCKCAQLYI